MFNVDNKKAFKTCQFISTAFMMIPRTWKNRVVINEIIGHFEDFAEHKAEGELSCADRALMSACRKISDTIKSRDNMEKYFNSDIEEYYYVYKLAEYIVDTEIYNVTNCDFIEDFNDVIEMYEAEYVNSDDENEEESEEAEESEEEEESEKVEEDKRIIKSGIRL